MTRLGPAPGNPQKPSPHEASREPNRPFTPPDAAGTRPQKLTERDFQNWVIHVARQFGWKAWHVPAPMRATRQGFVGAKEAAGLADLILIHHDPDRLIFAELKGSNGKLSVQQQEFLQAAGRVAAVTVVDHDGGRGWGDPVIGVYAWWPDDQETIERILRTRIML